MPYTNYYYNIPNVNIPSGSRSVASTYLGAICPVSAEFGRVHGSSPARATVKFKGALNIAAAAPLVLQIGASVFYGLIVKNEIDRSQEDGTLTMLSAVDYRDSLHDTNHFAQYNMLDESGAWWHILPVDWPTQNKLYVHQLQSIDDFTAEQTLPDYDLNLLANSTDNQADVPMLSTFALLSFFSMLYGFTVTYTDDTQYVMQTTYPDNLDWNSGRRVADCIQEILEKNNLQWTAYGNLNLHVTQKGVPDSYLEAAIMSGNVDLCAFGNFTDASLGSELNERGRRIVIAGGRNKYEQWYPCFPDWNLDFDAKVVFDGWSKSGLLRDKQITDFNLVEDLPRNFRDVEGRWGQFFENRHNNIVRNKMQIKDYIEQIPYKAYRIDFSTPLTRLYPGIDFDIDNDSTFLIDNPNQNLNFNTMTFDSNSLPANDPNSLPFNWLAWAANLVQTRNLTVDYGILDTIYPVSQSLVTDSERQMFCAATSRKLHQKGFAPDAFWIANGNFAYVNDGCSLETEEYIIPNGNLIPAVSCRKFYRVTVLFSDRRIGGTVVADNAAPVPGGSMADPPRPLTSFQWEPDQVYARVSLDGDLFTFTFGEGQNIGNSNPRVREIAKSENNLKRTFVYGQEVPMLVQDFIDQGFDNDVLAGDLAQQIAQRALNHEFITTAGHITFRQQAGYMPSGIIESVRDSFDDSRGVREVINFTNVWNDDRAVNFFSGVSRNRGYNRGEEELNRKSLQEAALKILRDNNKVGQSKEGSGKNNMEGNANPLLAGQAFGGEDNAAMVIIDPTDSGDVPDGELLVVSESGTGGLDING